MPTSSPTGRLWQIWTAAITWAGKVSATVRRSTSGKSFVDTNVLIYAHDVDAGTRHVKASTLLRLLWEERAGVLSPQVLTEFYVNVTRKIAKPLARTEARAIVGTYALWSVETSAGDVARAFEIEEETKISFWDALIVASAVKAGATTLLSEDLNAGQTIAGVRVENPIARR